MFWSKAYKLQCGTSADGEKSSAPGFLIPVLQQVIVAGKSMHMLHSLGRCREVAISAGKENYVLSKLFESLWGLKLFSDIKELHHSYEWRIRF